MGRKTEILIIPLLEQEPTRHALDVACRLARGRGSRVVLIAPLFVELELPLDAHFDAEEAALRTELDRERAFAESYGIQCDGRVVRARRGQLGPGVAQVASELGASLVVVGAPVQSRNGFSRPFSREVWSVLQDAPCPVLIATPPARQNGRAAA